MKKDKLKSKGKSRGFSFSLKPSILDRYIAYEFLIGYLVAVFVVLSLRVMMDLFLEFDEFIESDIGETSPSMVEVFFFIADYYTPKLFEYFRDFSGMMVMLASVFSLTRMSRQNELTAILASGISIKRVMAPVIFIAILLNLIMVADQEWVLPNIADKLVREHEETHGVRPISIWLMPEGNNSALISGTNFDNERSILHHFHVLFREDGELSHTISADAAQWNEAKQHWVLGSLSTLDKTFLPTGGEKEVDQNDGLQKTVVSVYPSSLSASYIWLHRNSNYKTLMSSAEITDLLDQKLLKPNEHRSAQSELHFRITDPLINVTMLILGLPMLVGRERHRSKKDLFLSLLLPGSCFVFTCACKLIGSDISTIDPVLTAWLPLMIFTPISVLTLDSVKT